MLHSPSRYIQLFLSLEQFTDVHLYCKQEYINIIFIDLQAYIYLNISALSELEP
jgi:hypothetical protein